MSGRARLLYVTAAFPWPPSEAFLIAEIDALLARGIDVTVLPTRLVEPPLALPAPLAGRARLCALPLVGRAQLAALLRLGASRPRTLARLLREAFGSGPVRGLKNLAVLPKAALVAEGLARGAGRPDHVHAHWAGVSSTLGWFVAELAELPWSLTAHSWDVAENNLLALKSARARFVRFISERERARGVARGALPERCRVIRLGVMPGPPEPLGRWSGDSPCRVVCIGSLLEVKGHRDLLDALGLLVARGRCIELTLFGDGPLRRTLERQAARLAVTLELAGNLPHGQLQRRLESGEFHVGALCSVVDRHGEDEGIPIGLLEIMRLGLPVVSTRSGSIPELLPDALGLSVAPGDVAAVAGVLERLIDDRAFYVDTARAVQTIARERFDVGPLTDELCRSMGLVGAPSG